MWLFICRDVKNDVSDILNYWYIEDT
jgi:hypothetical protein